MVSEIPDPPVLKLETHSPEEVSEIAKKILETFPENRIFVFYGEMGSGKTTLIRSLCEELGAGNIAKSPTFSIINEYESPGGSIFHFDFYRIKNLEEVFDLGYEEYFDSGEYCFIEWPEMIEPLIPENAIEVRIRETGRFDRAISLALRKDNE